MTLRPHTLSPNEGAKHRPKRVGRGNASGHGTMSGRGGKGQTARSGGSRGLKLKGFRRLMQSTPKLRGFRAIETKPTTVYLGQLEQKFATGATVDLAALKTAGIITKGIRQAKIVLKGELTKKLNVVGIAATISASARIKELGGTIQ